MRYWGITLVGILLLSIYGCAGNGGSLPDRQVSLRPVENLPLDGISVSQSGDQIALSFQQLPERGRFASLVVPDGFTISDVTWSEEESTLHLAVPVATGADFGIVPLSSYSGAEITASLSLVEGAKQTSQPPALRFSKAEDFTISYQDEIHIVAEWTEANIGDYDLNGIVTVADLTPLGRNYGIEYNINATNAPQNPLYWIDGSRDGFIGIYDLTMIGQNYGSSVGGYMLYAEGKQVDDPQGYWPTCQRIDTGRVTMRDGLPPYYRIVLPGHITEDWELAPVDFNYGLGEDSEDNRSAGRTPTVTINLELEGIPLFDQFYAHSDQSDNPFEYLRVIDPADIVDSMQIDERLEIQPIGQVYFNSNGQARLFNVPIGEMLLEVVYAPAVDLATGAAKSASMLSPADYQISALLINLNTPVEGVPTGLDWTINMVENPEGGYFATQTLNTTGSLMVDKTPTRVDYRTGTISRLSGMSGDYNYEAALGDSDGDGVSEARLAQELDLDLYQAIWTLGKKYIGTINSFDETAGELILVDAAEVTTGGETPIAGDLLIYFSELTTFGEIEVGGDYNNSNALDPSSLAVGDDLVLGVYILNNEDLDLPTKYWANVIVRQLPES
ncbi:hypothetical protein JW859_11480 [bacterium]|nr:hypothetical protein [bacterium]